MKKCILFFCCFFLLQSICFAQSTFIDWEYRLRGDTIASFFNGTVDVVDTLNFKRGCIIQKEYDNSISFMTHSTRRGILIPGTTKFNFNSISENPIVLYYRTNRLNQLNKNNFQWTDFDNHRIYLFVDWNNTIFQCGNRILSEGWEIDSPEVKRNLGFFGLEMLNNVTVLSNISLNQNSNSSLQVLAVGYTRNGTSIVPKVYHFVVSQIFIDQSVRSKEIQPIELQAASPIATAYSNANLNHTILFGNLRGTNSFENGYEIVVLDTALNELYKIRTDSTQLLSSDGIIYPTNLFTVNDKIFVTGFIDYGNLTVPFYSEHSSNGEFLKSQIVNTNATINSGSVSPDGKTVLMCGSVLNANDNSDFFVVAINTETGSSTQKTWGDNRVNELFDVLAISNDTAYITGSEDKDFYAGRLINLQTMSVSEPNELNSEIEVMPNPASTSISITSQNLQTIHSTVTIQNLQGQTVATVFEGIPISNEIRDISIAHLPTGTYFVTLENGKNTYRAKFIVKR